MPVRHLLCYIRRDSLTRWKLDSVERGRGKSPVLAYGSNDPAFAEFAKEGNVLWVIGAHPDGPPSLEAKITIAEQRFDDKVWKCEAHGSPSGSAFFGLNDASSAVMQLVFRNRNSSWSLREKHSTTQWKNAFGMDLQSPRRLAPAGDIVNGHCSPGAAPLEELATVATNRSVFISWKHSDNNRARRRFIKALAIELGKRQFSVWLDKLALTNVEAVDRYSKNKKNDLMGQLLSQGLSHCSAVLAMWTVDYGTASTLNSPNWTLNEWSTRNAVVRIAMVSGRPENKPSMTAPDQFLRIPPDLRPDEAPDIARQFTEAYESIMGRSRG